MQHSEILQFFSSEHLPSHLAEVVRPFAELVLRICETLPDNEERAVAMRKLLEAKDAAIRASLLAVRRAAADREQIFQNLVKARGDAASPWVVRDTGPPVEMEPWRTDEAAPIGSCVVEGSSCHVYRAINRGAIPACRAILAVPVPGWPPPDLAKKFGGEVFQEGHEWRWFGPWRASVEEATEDANRWEAQEPRANWAVVLADGFRTRDGR